MTHSVGTVCDDPGMTFPPTDTDRRFSIIPQPPVPEGKPVEFNWSIPPEPIVAPAYSESDPDVTLALAERLTPLEPEAPPEPTARQRFEQRQAEREMRPEADFDWGAEPHDRQWSAVELFVMLLILVFIIIDVVGVFVGDFDLWSVGIGFGALCGLIVFRAAWARYEVGAQMRDLLLELRLIREV